MPGTNNPLEDEPGTSWWVIDLDRLCQIAGILGWACIALAGIAAGVQGTVLTIASLLLLGVILVEASPLRGTRARIAYVVLAQVIFVLAMAARLA